MSLLHPFLPFPPSFPFSPTPFFLLWKFVSTFPHDLGCSTQRFSVYSHNSQHSLKTCHWQCCWSWPRYQLPNHSSNVTCSPTFPYMNEDRETHMIVCTELREQPTLLFKFDFVCMGVCISVHHMPHAQGGQKRNWSYIKFWRKFWHQH